MARTLDATAWPVALSRSERRHQRVVAQERHVPRHRPAVGVDVECPGRPDERGQRDVAAAQVEDAGRVAGQDRPLRVVRDVRDEDRVDRRLDGPERRPGAEQHPFGADGRDERLDRPEVGHRARVEMQVLVAPAGGHVLDRGRVVAAGQDDRHAQPLRGGADRAPPSPSPRSGTISGRPVRAAARTIGSADRPLPGAALPSSQNAADPPGQRRRRVDHLGPIDRQDADRHESRVVGDLVERGSGCPARPRPATPSGGGPGNAGCRGRRARARRSRAAPRARRRRPGRAGR